MHILCISVICINLFVTGSSYKILGLFPFPGSSHYVMFESLMKELATKGHEVDVVSHFPQEKPIPRFNDLSIKGTMLNMRNSISIALLRSLFKDRFSFLGFLIEYAGVNFCELAFNTTTVQQLIASETKYDLVITEIFGNDCMLAFGHHFKVPVVVMMSSVVLPWGNDRFGNPDNPGYLSAYFVPYVGQMNLLQRIDNTIMLLLSKFWYSSALSRNTAIVRKSFGDDMPNLEQLILNISLLLVNSHYSLTGVRPNVPSVVEVGGLHISPTKPLPQNFQEILNITPSEKYQGIILFSLGSMILTESLPPQTLKELLDAFGELPYKVLWKATKENMPSNVTVPSNIYFEKWIPQSDVLCHPNLKLFVTHGGLMGTQEAIYCGVPCLGIPLFADQAANVNILQTYEIGLSLDYDTFTKEDVSKATKELLFNPKYKANAEIVSERFKDRPLSALDTAVYWVEYVIRHKGARHLRSPAVDLSWYQYHLLDVGAILLFVLLLVSYITYKVIVLFINLLCGSKKLHKQKVN